MFLFLAAHGHDGDRSRARIMAVIRQNPGCHYAEIARRTDLAWDTVRYHVKVLQRHKLISLTNTDREVHAFPVEIPVENRSWMIALRDQDSHRILTRLIETPGIGVTQLSTALDIRQKIIRRHLTTLVDADILVQRGELRPVFEPTVLGRRLMAHEQGQFEPGILPSAIELV